MHAFLPYKGASDDDDGAIEDFEGGEEYDSEQRQKMRAVIAQKLKKLEDANKSAREGDHEKKTSRR